MTTRVASAVARILGVALLWGAAASPAEARPPYKKALADYLGPFADA